MFFLFKSKHYHSKKKANQFEDNIRLSNNILVYYYLYIEFGVWGFTLPSHATEGRFLLSKTWLAS